MADQKEIRQIISDLQTTAKEAAGQQTETDQTVSETWAQDIIEDLDDFIESQGIYLRQ